MKEKVVIGMSGGVDSSVAALILKERGYDVTGVMLKLTDSGDSAEKDAERVAREIGIDFFMFDLREKFRSDVIGYFVSEYLGGATPNPCVMCNKTVKFGAMAEIARSMGIGKLATGHYVKTAEKDGRILLCRSQSLKDQSYFLSYLTQNQLKNVIFPLCDMEKDEIREKARQAGLSVSEKKDSQEICFIPDNDYVSFICKNTGELPSSGDFVDRLGNVIGRHNGVLRYTVGQRKGLGAFGKPMFVTRIDVANNRVVLGENGEQYSKGFIAENLNWQAFDEPPEEFRAKVKVRYKAKPSDATVYTEGDTVRVVFDESERSVTPGQTAVFCDDEYILGAGRIKIQL